MISLQDQLVINTIEFICERETPITSIERDMILFMVTSTTSHEVREACATAISQLPINEGEQVLLDLINRPDTQGHRAVLLWALKELKQDTHLPVTLVGTLLREDLDDAMEVMDFIAQGHVSGSRVAFDAVIAVLTTRLQNPNPFDAHWKESIGAPAIDLLCKVREKL